MRGLKSYPDTPRFTAGPVRKTAISFAADLEIQDASAPVGAGPAR